LSFTVEELADVSINELKYYGTCQASTISCTTNASSMVTSLCSDNKAN